MVGHDEEYLLQHRTESVVIVVHVGEILLDQGVWKAYDDAEQELTRRYDVIGIHSATDVLGDLARRLWRGWSRRPRSSSGRQTSMAELEQRLEDQRLQY